MPRPSPSPSRSTRASDRRRRASRAGRAALAAGIGLLAAALPALTAPAPATAASTVPNSVALVSQTPWVRTTSGMHLELAIRSDLPRADLGVQVTLWSQATQRGYFEQTLSGNMTDFSPLSTPPVMPLTTRHMMQPNGDASIFLPVAPPAVPGKAVKPPTNGAVLSLPCEATCTGVYPLQVSLEDLRTYTPLDSFMTYLILAPNTAASPLRFSWTLPVGSTPATTPSGAGAASGAAEKELEQLDSVLSANPTASVSVALFPQLTDALRQEAAAGAPSKATQRSSRRSQAEIKKRSGAAKTALAAVSALGTMPNVEIEQETYTPLDLASMAGSSLGAEVSRQLAAGRQALGALGIDVRGRPLASTEPMGNRALALLTHLGVTHILVPSSSVTAIPPTWDYPVWAPFKVRGTAADVDASDYFLEQHLASGSDPVLRANQLLADLALLYFVEQPPGNRGVTLLSPAGWHPSSQFLSTVLSGLASSPIVRSDTLSQFFGAVRPGSDEIPAGMTVSPLLYRGLTAGHIPATDAISRYALGVARRRLSALAQLLPKGGGLVGRYRNLLLLGETAGLAQATRAAYFAAPTRKLAAEANGVTLPHDRTITITSLSARIPISVSSRASVPLAVDLELSSCPFHLTAQVCRGGGLTFRRHVFGLLLQPGNRTIEVHVATPAAGDFSLYLQLTTPSGGFALASSRVTVRSTAISAVAVALTVAAAAFLVIWWTRSAFRRRRRGRHAKGTPEPEPPAGAPTAPSPS